ncbi:hypothetical protein RND59_11320 [Vibrio ruber]|uniref:hypothetical protein n=1 Tax=Vibrio ruber TaxID=184755 RepID=UPI002892C195|nr:hypothetical protein [Vibrio ruber]WNJ94721.1 hypothetical protein RND59_11320 [Vibrio ruber]
MNQVFFETMPRRELRKTPRERFITYQKDLHRIAQDQMDESTLLEGDQYSYTELGDHILDKALSSGGMDSVDLTIFSYWTPEFDPEHSAFGPYFMNKYQLKGHSFDVCDNGSLASSTAFMIADSYLTRGETQKILLLGMEQNTIPRNLKQGFPVPERSYASVALLTPEETADSTWMLMDSGQISEWDMFQGIDAYKTVEKILATSGVCAADVVLLTQRTGLFCKKLMFQIDSDYKKHEMEFSYLSPGVTGMNMFVTLANQTLSNICKPFVLLIDHDVESLRVSWSLLKKLKD